VGGGARPHVGGLSRHGALRLVQALGIERFNQRPFPGVSLDALKFLHQERNILFHGHEPLDTDTTPNLEGEYWLMHNHYAQAECAMSLDKVPEAGQIPRAISPSPARF
jgi:kynurenine formamidase